MAPQEKLYAAEDLENWGIAKQFREAEDCIKNNREIPADIMSLVEEADQTGDLPEIVQNMLDVRYDRKK